MLGTATVAAVILAAGRSSRMGTHKLLLPLGDAPLLAHVVGAACASAAAPVILVLGHEAERVRAALPAGRAEIVVNQVYADGMATSLRAGITLLEYLEAEGDALLGTLVLLGDQPLVTVPLLDRLIEEASARPETLLTASYGGRRGPPVYFPRASFAETAELRGDEGGRAILARHADRVCVVECAFPEAGTDIDTPEDYERLRRMWASQPWNPAG